MPAWRCEFRRQCVSPLALCSHFVPHPSPLLTDRRMLATWRARAGPPGRAIRRATFSNLRACSKMTTCTTFSLVIGFSYVLAFESRGAIVASDARVHYARYLAFHTEVSEAARQGWVFADPEEYRRAATYVGVSVLDPGCAAVGDTCLKPSQFISWLKSHDVGYQVLRAEPFLAIVPDHSISSPERVLARYGIH